MSDKTIHSIVEVAKAANVSVTTASRVLSGSTHPVSEEKRNRVLEAASRLNYSPSALAQAMVTGDTRIVGVIIGDAMDPYFATIVRGIEDAAREYGYMVIVCNSDRDPEVEIAYLKTLNDYRVDGLIFAGGGLDSQKYVDTLTETLEVFRKRGAVAVSLARQNLPVYQVGVDNRAVVRDAVGHLASLGHTRIAYVSGPQNLTTTHSRLMGYQLALEAFGLEQDPALIMNGDYTYQAGLRVASEIHSADHKPTAILASNDLMAIGCLVGLRELAYKIPRDLSVMGIDDIAFARFVDPPLTTVSIPMYDLGRTGMESLVNLRRGAVPKTEKVVLDHQIVVRKSAGAPANKENMEKII